MEPRPRSWAKGVHGPQVREPVEGAGLTPGTRSDDVGKRGLSDHLHLADRAAKVASIILRLCCAQPCPVLII